MPVTYSYPSTVPQEFDFKDSVRAASTAALPANTRSGNRLTADANGALAAQDGVTLVVGDRYVVKNEVTGANNGIYTLSALGTGTLPWIMDRAADADASSDVTSGMFVSINEGTTNGDTIWQLTTNDPITLNTTALTFAQFGAGGASGWTDDGAIVRLTTAADTVAIGAATMSGAEKIRVVGDARIEGAETITGNLSLSAAAPQINATGANAALFIQGNLSAATAAPDVEVRTQATKTAGQLFAVRNLSTLRFYVPYQGAVIVAQGVATVGTAQMLSLTGAAHTGQTASTEINFVDVNQGTVTWLGGALATQRCYRFRNPTLAFAAASTVTDTATVSIEGAPVAGTNATLTRNYGLWIQGGGFRVAGNIGFFDTAPIAQQAGVENITNNVTAGGVDGTIANYTDLATYATDAAAIRNDIYQLARSLAQVKNAMRAYGLLT